MAKLQLPKITITRNDYWKIGPLYIWKWLAVLAAASLSMFALKVFGLPKGLPFSRKLPPPTYSYDDLRLAGITGLVKVKDNKGVVRYEGEVAQGAYTGTGKVYDEDGQLVYDGPLVDGVYEGSDAKVYESGKLVYSGEMAKNTYEGQGRRTSLQTGVVSEGQFSCGELEGGGKEYDEYGTLIRTGEFSHDLLNGSGLEYNSEGILIREGDFTDGMLNGSGTEYTENGDKRYEGEFQRGIYNGEGKLYDTRLHCLSYEGEFVNGKAIGEGQIYHPSGQLLYEGTVYENQPRADAFLGLSLADLEGAFTEHWLLYSCDDMTAFVYPYFKLMFATESEVKLVSPSKEENKEESDRQELLDAVKSSAQSKTAETVQSKAGQAKTSQAKTQSVTTNPDTKRETVSDKVLDTETVKKDIVISEVLSYSGTLPGTAQPEQDAETGEHQFGWREWFSLYADGDRVNGPLVKHTGQFIYEFIAPAKEEKQKIKYAIAEDGGVQTMTVLKEGKKEMPRWYQSAVRKET